MGVGAAVMAGVTMAGDSLSIFLFLFL